MEEKQQKYKRKSTQSQNFREKTAESHNLKIANVTKQSSNLKEKKKLKTKKPFFGGN